MRFHCDGSDHDTRNMIAFATPNRAMPFIYLSQDGTEVFVQTMDRQQGVRIRRAEEAEIRRLAEMYHLPELLGALARSRRIDEDTSSAERSDLAP